MEVITSKSLLHKDPKQRGYKGDLNANQKDQLSLASVRHQTYETQDQEHVCMVVYDSTAF